jgi:hypothetical protein
MLKIVATIVFLTLASIFSFMWGYRKENPTNGEKYSPNHRFWNGMKWSK